MAFRDLLVRVTETVTVRESRQPGGLREIPGFASPPRDGFALSDIC